MYVYSTLTAGVDYATYKQLGDEKAPVVVEEVISIAGGTNVADKNLITPRGVATKVTPEQVEQLRQNQVFRLHEANGFVTISNKREDPENVAADLTTRDESAPLVDADFEAEGVMPPTTEVVAPSTGRASRKA